MSSDNIKKENDINSEVFSEKLSNELKEDDNTGTSPNPDFAGRELDVFISYSSLNKNVADAVVSNFEQHGIRCWYAPRDIMPGQEWVTAIHEAINACRLFVLIYTDSSNESKQVANEVALAFNSGKTLIPFRLSDTEMSTELEYYLTRVHWLDAVKPPLMQSIESLRTYSEKILKGIDTKESKVKNANVLKTQMPGWVLPAIIVLAIGLLTISIILLFKNDEPKSVNVSTDNDQINSISSSAVTAEPNKNDDSDSISSGIPKLDNINIVEEDHFMKAYEIQKSEEGDSNRYELAYEEYMLAGENETTTEEIAQAMDELGMIFSIGSNQVEINNDKARNMFLKSSSSGNALAFVHLGNLYMNADLPELEDEPDYKKALDYYLMAVEKDNTNAEAMYNIAYIYENGGYGVEQNIDETLKYYEMSYQNGNNNAKSKYESLKRLSQD
ncbi:MAG: toll/interleukin-1 receptor domain-containing protein [Lachnospiraceae bacterium]|nr:toll/interleukin-1 receptor domain-containing protein [Lachnospiraceae bacterium]